MELVNKVQILVGTVSVHFRKKHLPALCLIAIYLKKGLVTGIPHWLIQKCS